MSAVSSNFGSLNRNTSDLQYREIGNIDDVLKYQKSRIIQVSDLEQQQQLQGSGSNNTWIINCPISHECDSLNNRIIIPNAQTILQETIQTDTANLIDQLQNGGIQQKNIFQKSQSEFLEQKLNSMKQKHKQLQQQLSEATKIESVSNKKKNIAHSQSTQGFFKGGVSNSHNLDIFNFGNLKNQIKQMDVIQNILSSIQLKPSSQQKDIEVIIEKNDLYRILKILIDQLVSYIEKLNAVVSERDIIEIQRQAAEKQNYEQRDVIRMLEEELKINKKQLTETEIDYERQKALYDILESKYIDLLKKKQEVKIINKETIKEIVVEKPIEILKEVKNVKIVKQKKEVRKIIRPQPEVKHTIEKKLHILEREKIVNQLQVVEKIKEIPKIEFVDKERIIEKPFIVEKLVDRIVEVPKFIPKEVIVDRPVYVDRPVEKIVKVPQIIEKEKLVDRPVFIEKPVDRVIEKEVFVDRPVYIQEPPVHIEKVVQVPKIVEKQKIIDRPIYINNPPLERFVEKPVFINKYEPISTQLVNSYSVPSISTQINSPAAVLNSRLVHEQNFRQNSLFSPLNSIQLTHSQLQQHSPLLKYSYV